MENENLVIAINNDDTAVELDIPAASYFSDSTRIRFLLGSGEAQVVEGRIRGLQLPAREAVVLELAPAG
jgi:hypothetical protein